ncbi:MAG: hypothetical protein RLZZ15_640 [Verrucomicrobiota bacterium]|jgi:hypothetical protein
MKAFPELAAALGEMLDRMDVSLRAGRYSGPAVVMYLAGGVAVNYYCGTRYTEDVDASFSHRFVLPKDLSVNYRRRDGSEAFIYFDPNYNTSFALLHEGFEDNAREWTGIGNETRLVHLRVLAPLDLAVSKIARFSEQDRADIRALGAEGFFTAAELRAHAVDAMRDFIGDKRPLLTSLDLIERELAR